MMEIMHEHPWAVMALVTGVILLGFIAISALIVFTRWVVHSEVRALTSALHREVQAIAARLDNLIGRKWTDDRLDRKFDDIQSVLNVHETDIRKLSSEHMRFHGPAKGE